MIAPSESPLLLAIGLGEKRIVRIFCGRADGNFGISESVFLMDYFLLPSQFKTLLSCTRWKIRLKIRWKIRFLKLPNRCRDIAVAIAYVGFG